MLSSQHSASADVALEIAPALPTCRLTLIPELTPDPRDADTPSSSFPCVICTDVGYEEYPEADTFVDALEKPLNDARLTPHGYICSRACMSQLMFQCADNDQQEKLLRFERALTEIADTAPDLVEMFAEWEIEFDVKKLCRKADEARAQLGCISRLTPKWIEGNDAPEVALVDAIRSAVRTLDWKVGDSLRVEIMSELRKIGNKDFAYPKASEYQVWSSARALASLGNVMLLLKEVIA